MLLRKLSLLLIPLLLVTASVLPGRAQEDLSGRYAFADTTLLRDTLGLKFTRLFQLADSLQLTPDTLRALSVRYRVTLPRLVSLSDSLHVPVDSVGVTLERERFNPLAARTAATNEFAYNTTYNLQQTRSSWVNGSDYNFVLGSLFLRNVTTIQLDRFATGGGTALWQTRDANTEVGWRLSPDYSFGGRAVMNRFNSDDPSTITGVGETRNEYQLSMRTRHRPTRFITSEFNLFSGAVDLRNAEQEKHGWSADANGRFRQTSGRWFVHELTGRLNASLSKVNVVSSSLRENSRDLIGNLNGSVSLFNASRVGFKTTYNAQTSDVGQPDVAGAISRVKSSRASADAAVRTRLGPDGYLNLTQRVAHIEQVTVLNGPSSRNTNSISLDGRTTWWGWGLESRFQTEFANSETPQAAPTGGYGERSTVRALDGAMTRHLFGRLNARVSARIGLNSYRYRVIGDYGSPPVSRDQATQSYMAEGTYVVSNDFNTGLSLEVGRNQLVNLPSVSTAANNTLRTYRAEWRWTYRLLTGLTATQRNTMGANYTSYNFLTGADRLSLDYGTATTLNAVLTPRLSFDLNHSGQVQPSGNWTRQADGLYYFQPADESRVFSLSSRIQYTPASVLSFSLIPTFRSSERDGTLNGVSSPQRRSRNLNFQGGANLNLPVGQRGLLSGSVGRTYFADRSITFAAGAPTPSPRSELDYWTGALQFSWRP